MTKRCVVLGCGRRVGLDTYVNAWKKAIEIAATNPDQWVPQTPRGYGGTVAEALREFRDGMHDRINRHIPGYGNGRNWEYGHYMETWRAARALNGGVVIHWLPKHLKARFAHRLEAG